MVEKIKFRIVLTNQKILSIIMFVYEMPACRNGRRGRLKICCGQPRAGSSPAAGSKTLVKYHKGFVVLQGEQDE